MGRRRRKVVKIPKKRLPKIFLCPRCGKESVRVIITKGQEIATVQCGSCGLKGDVPMLPTQQPIDVYCKFADDFYASVKMA